jgi:transketolase
MKELEDKCKIIRKHIIRMLTIAGSGHTGGSLSVVEILVALFFNIMKHDPKNPKFATRDRFILSKGHAAPALYATLAECGYFSPDLLFSLRKLGSPLQGHLDKRMFPFLEASTGSLGQGLSIGIGISLGLKLDNNPARVYVVMSDGECDEGQVWEAAMFASFHKIDNLTAIIDYNKQQLDGWIKDILNLEPFIKKWESFNWFVQEIDGHNIKEIIDAVNRTKEVKGKPSVIIAHTIKGKGVSFMENNPKYHGIAPTKEEEIKALQELE